MNFMTKLYRSYREARKARGRKRKALKQKAIRMAFYSQFLQPGQICFDIGANLGNRTEAFLEMGCKVIAVEPQKVCVEHLQSVYGDNPNLVIINKALDKESGQKEIYIGEAKTLSSMSKEWIECVRSEDGPFKGFRWDTKEIVETDTLNALIQQYGKPAFCKIDVEGFEYNVLQGLSQQIDALSFEFSLGVVDSTIQCIDYLARLGPTVFNYSLGESMHMELPQYVDKDDIIDILKNLTGGKSTGGDIYAKRNSE
ncbi:MAG: FkbM family methyltransferase [Phycisphaerae bacterium]|nr:FkbM family methyltransferase [Phycisphaerae bacterium]